MTDQQKAERLAEESLKRWGFVVVGYVPDTIERNMNRPTNTLWKIYEMPQPFVAIRKATEREWEQQRALAGEIFGRKPLPQPFETPLVLVTD